MASNAMLSARLSNGTLAGVSTREPQSRHGLHRTVPSRLGGYRTLSIDDSQNASFPRSKKPSVTGCPKPFKPLRVSCLQSESCGVRSPSYAASEAVKVSRIRFKEEVTKPDDDDIDLAKSALLIAAEDQAQEVYNFCKKLSAALKEHREPPVLPNTFAAARRDVSITMKSDGPLQLRVGGHTVDYWLGFLSALAREVETRFVHLYGEDAARSPLRLITLVNEILFSEFGFNGRIRSGDLRNSYLHLTLQTGRGTATMMSIVYIEVLKRVGLAMVGAPLSPDYFLCWPVVDGVQIAFDPHHNGQGYLRNDIEHMYKKMLPLNSAQSALPSRLPSLTSPSTSAPTSSLTSTPTSPRTSTPTTPRSNPTSPRGGNVEEMLRDAELEVEVPQEVEEMVMRPASNRQIVASLLRTLRNISLQQAVRALRSFALLAPLGHASKAFEYPLAPAALQGVLDRDKMRHAISLSERLILLTPHDSTARRDHALLLYHNKQYGQAKSELEAYIEMGLTESDEEAARILIERIGLMIQEERLWSQPNQTTQ